MRQSSSRSGSKNVEPALVRALVGFLQGRKGVDFRICQRHGRFAGVRQVESEPYQITNL